MQLQMHEQILKLWSTENGELFLFLLYIIKYDLFGFVQWFPVWKAKKTYLHHVYFFIISFCLFIFDDILDN